MHKSIEEKLEHYSMPEPNSGCVIWIGALTRSGYGNVVWGGKWWPAHRLSYLLHKGEIPDGLEMDHLCRNRACINPDHLEAVTRQTNLLRGETIPARHRAKTHCPHGHEYTPENTYVDVNNSRNCIICRREVGRRQRRKGRGVL